MRRKKKGSKRDRRQTRDQVLARTWMARIESGKKAKNRYNEDAKEVAQYFKSKHEMLYRSKAFRRQFDFQGAAAVSVPKSAQVRMTLGPRLYQKNPRRVVKVKRQRDGVGQAFATILSAYINYTPEEVKLAKSTRKACDDSITNGRGFMQTGYDDELGLVCSWRIRSRDVVIDPDVYDIEQAMWIAVRSYAPLWQVKRDFGGKGKVWRLRGLSANVRHQPRKTSLNSDEYDVDEDEVGPPHEPTNEVLEYWTVYSKMGAGVSRGADVEDKYRNDDDPDDYVKIVVASDHPCPLFEGAWDFPIYLDKEWPLTPLDLVESDDLWPTSILALALSSQKAIDVLASLGLKGAKRHSQDRYFVDASVGKQVMQRFQQGGEAPVIPITVRTPQRIQDMVHRFDAGSMSPEIANERQWHERIFHETTGTMPSVTGNQDVGAVDRSATQSRIKVDAANTRVADLEDRVEDFASRIGRNEALAVRLMLEPEEVEEILGKDELRLGYYLALPDPTGGTMPVYSPTKLREGKPPRDLSVEYLCPPCARYYETQAEVANAIPQLLLPDLDKHIDPRSELVMRSVEAVLATAQEDPAAWLELIKPVRVKDVWNDTKGVSAKELMREFSYSINTGSIRKLDPVRKVELADSAMTTIMPIALQTAQFDVANALLQNWYEANEFPEEDRVQLRPPPAPQPAAQPPQGGQQ